MSAIWTPHLTVAAVIERNGEFLLVEEQSEGLRVFNQPAGHVEEDETIHEAVVREVLEETGCVFNPQGICGLYRWRSPRNLVTYLRVAFYGDCITPRGHIELDTDIIATHWLNDAQIRARENALRSPLVLRCIDDYQLGKQLPLDILQEL